MRSRADEFRSGEKNLATLAAATSVSQRPCGFLDTSEASVQSCVVSRRRQALIGMVAVTTAALFLFLLWSSSEKEPSHGGRSLSEWYKVWAKNNDASSVEARAQADAAVDAIRQIGTNALPILLQRLQR